MYTAVLLKEGDDERDTSHEVTAQFFDIAVDIIGASPDHQPEARVVVRFLEECAWAYFDKSEWVKAERLYNEALELSRTNLTGEDSLALAQSFLLAAVRLKQGRIQEARANQDNALKASIRLLGPHHSSTIRHRLIIASCYDLEGHQYEARRMYSEAIYLPVMEPHLATKVDVLEMATRFASRALALLELFRSEKDPTFDTRTLHEFGIYLLPQHLWSKGLKRERALIVQVRMFVDCMLTLAWLLFDAEDEGLIYEGTRVAEPYWNVFTDYLIEIRGPGDVVTLDVIEAHALAYLTLGKDLEGEKMLREVLERRESVLPPGDFRTQSTVELLRDYLLTQDRCHEAAVLEYKLDEMDAAK